VIPQFQQENWHCTLNKNVLWEWTAWWKCGKARIIKKIGLLALPNVFVFDYELCTCMRSARSSDRTQRWVVMLCRRFGTTYWFHLQGSKSPRITDSILTFFCVAQRDVPTKDFECVHLYFLPMMLAYLILTFFSCFFLLLTLRSHCLSASSLFHSFVLSLHLPPSICLYKIDRLISAIVSTHTFCFLNLMSSDRIAQSL
jgi:hypothetical protein